MSPNVSPRPLSKSAYKKTAANPATIGLCQRLEQLGKQVVAESADDGAVTVLASAATAERLGPEFARDALGGHRLRGRDETIEVFRLR